MTKKKKSKGDKPARLEKLVLNITAPVKMNLEIGVKNIGVFVGANASGKSLMLKIMYALGAIGVSSNQGSHMSPTAAAQFVFDSTFKQQNFNGSLKAIYTKGSVAVELANGKVTKVEIKDLEKPVPVTFMSSDMRTFDAMSVYLRMRKTSGDDPVVRMKELLAAYRLYDLTYMETLIARCPIYIPEPMKAALKGTFDFEESIAFIDVDLDKCTFTAISDDRSRRDVTTYGKGHQAVLNMFVGSGL